MLPNQKILFYFMIVKNVSMIESKKIVKMCKPHNFVKGLTGKKYNGLGPLYKIEC